MRRAGILPFALALPVLCGCVTDRPTRRLYEEIQELRLTGFACVGGPPAGLDARLASLDPWLEATLGAGAVAQAEERFNQENATLDLVRCPTTAERRRATRAYSARLGTLERRAR